MSARIDLHLHSTASDGAYTPSELVRLALAKKLQVIALTDHDTTGGIEEIQGAARGTGLTVIPGVEISTDVPGNQELHILGYYIDHRYEPLQRQLLRLRQSRMERARKMIEILDRAGCHIDWDHLLALAGKGSIGRPHIAQALVEANYVDSIEDAFRLYLGRGAAAYVLRYKLSPQDAIKLILAAGGAPVLAHPSQVIEHIPALSQAGLAGLEVYYYNYPEPEKRFLAGLARKHNLIATGGSDFHGPGVTSTAELGSVDVPWSAFEELRAYAARKARDGSQL
jgi:predicted metal-dependent phosphoesterase TrpH